MTLPFSRFASPQAKKEFLNLVSRPYPQPEGPLDSREMAAKYRQKFDTQYYLPLLRKFRARYPVTIEPRIIAGIQTDIVAPKGGIAPKNETRVLINLHGGGFVIGARAGGQVESVPVASVGKIKVFTVDYREAPEFKFPAASEDVAAVYRELLQDYDAESIGIFGCSAGGLLTAEAVSWFQKLGLPKPGAIAILCGSAGGLFEGDSAYLWPSDDGLTPRGARESLTYFQGVDPLDPLVSPGYSPAGLAQFPPTLIMTSTRGVDLSPSVYADVQLTKAGVISELHVWEGLGHGGFINSPDIPETEDAIKFVVRFFDRHLKRTKGHRSRANALGPSFPQ
jgi:acetyl esterase/lipase